MHWVASAADQPPAAQISVTEVLAQKEPAAQGAATVEPRGQYEPTEQAVRSAPPPQYEPAGQGAQADSAEVPLEAEPNEPAAHWLHSVAPAAAQPPAGQSSVTDVFAHAEPAAHRARADEPEGQ